MNSDNPFQDILETEEFGNTSAPNLFESESESKSSTKSEPPKLNDNELDSELLSSVLDPIPVFTIADEEGAPLVTDDEDEDKIAGKAAGIFISQEDADEFVVKLRESNSKLADKVQVIPVSLGQIYELDVAGGEEDILDFAFVPEEEAVEDATSTLADNGEEYEGGVPLFIARSEKGYLTVERNGQQVIPFFFDLDQLEELTAKFEAERPDLASNLTIEVNPLEGVIETLATSDNESNDNEVLEKIVLIPTDESTAFLATDDSGFGDNGRENVYRFFDRNTGLHRYTTAEAEKDDIVDNLPNYDLEGVSYRVLDPLTGMKDASVVHRFRNQDTGVDIYTIDEAERSFIADNLSNYEYEGEAFAVYTTSVEGTIPIHRFYNAELDAHLYTPSEKERESIESDLPDYEYEGIAYHAFPAEI